MKLWDFMKVAVDFNLQSLSFQGLWETGRKLKSSGDRSLRAKVSQSLVPALVWALWLARNSRVFRNTRVYPENI
ncbi:hypothetical protein QJS10_CPA08g01041 [Acorus calamus]|uniref:Uncharacterized protein n=1 Tax=Acorus calamus TaxID=4465 RepID=A0AAV9EEK5_ACOCL|nr:hypothetical protein QJS10_CPA08g01041 [Acorus calamus]